MLKSKVGGTKWLKWIYETINTNYHSCYWIIINNWTIQSWNFDKQEIKLRFYSLLRRSVKPPIKLGLMFKMVFYKSKWILPNLAYILLSHVVLVKINHLTWTYSLFFYLQTFIMYVWRISFLSSWLERNRPRFWRIFLFG